MVITKRQKLRKVFKEFCNESSFEGYSYLVRKETTYFEKAFWIILHLTTLTVSIFLVVHLGLDFLKNPTVVSLETSNFPITQVKFPGVAICNLNKFSKRRAIEFAYFLQNHTKNDFDYVLSNIQLLANLYDYDTKLQEKFVPFQLILEKYDNNNKAINTDDDNSNNNQQSFYDPTQLLKRLATPCNELLLECYLGGKKRNCSEIFQTRMTFEGFCCTFNYLRPVVRQYLYPSANKKLTQSFKQKDIGVTKGLTIIVNNDISDYFYTTLGAAGVNVHIFYPKDYPDRSSGGLSEILVNKGYEAFIQIQADTMITTDAVKKIPQSQRNCIFEDDSSTIFGNYRYSDCFVDCRVHSMLSLCDCITFDLPVKMTEDIRVCTLPDIPCLNKYKRKWSTYYPEGVDGIEELKQELHDSIYCAKKCKPACHNTNYRAYTNFIQLKNRNLSNNEMDINQSIIHIYFDQLYTNLYKQDVVFTWFELLSNFAGIFSLFMGLSIINLVEILYFLVYKLLRS